MTTAHSSTAFRRALRHEPPKLAACLMLRWSVAASALGRPGRRALALELELPLGEPARLTLAGQPLAVGAWLDGWAGRLNVRRLASGQAAGLIVADASPLAVAVFSPATQSRPLHVSCDLPKALGLTGGRYELVGGELAEH